MTQLTGRVRNYSPSNEAMNVMAAAASTFVAKDAIYNGLELGVNVWAGMAITTMLLGLAFHALNVSERDPMGGPTRKQHVSDIIALACYAMTTGIILGVMG